MGPVWRALTLWRPWSDAVVTGQKLVENRPWAPPDSAFGKTIAIHAGKVWDPSGVILLDKWGVTYRPREQSHPGAVVGVVTLRAALKKGDPAVLLRGSLDNERLQSSIVDPMFLGPWGWVLADAFKLPTPIPCKGALGLWRLPVPEVDQVEEQLP